MTVNWSKMLEYKNDIVNQNTKGIEFLFKKKKNRFNQRMGIHKRTWFINSK